jgi:3',5'-cyclic-AMP phosphodiesterase
MRGHTVRRGASLVLASLLCASSVSCVASLADFFDESSDVTGRVKESQAMTIAPPTSPSISTITPFSFLVVGDPHFGASFAAGQDVLDSFSALAGSNDANGKPYAFVLYLGDDADGGLATQFQAFASWAGSMKDSNGIAMQWYSAVGNHDLYNGGWTSFKQYVGPSFYKLSVGAYSIYVLDSGQGTVGDYQIDELRSEFASDPNPKIVVSHYAVYAAEQVLYYYRLSNPREVAELLDLFARSNVKLILAGHWHYLVHESIGPMDEWLVESLTVTDGDKTHCFAVTLDGASESPARLAF